jgi:hypothetical protein
MYRIKDTGIEVTCSTGRERRGSYRVPFGKPEGKRRLGRHRYMCVYIQKGISKLLFGGGGGKLWRFD